MKDFKTLNIEVKCVLGNAPYRVESRAGIAELSDSTESSYNETNLVVELYLVAVTTNYSYR